MTEKEITTMTLIEINQAIMHKLKDLAYFKNWSPRTDVFLQAREDLITLRTEEIEVLREERFKQQLLSRVDHQTGKYQIAGRIKNARVSGRITVREGMLIYKPIKESRHPRARSYPAFFGNLDCKIVPVLLMGAEVPKN